MKSIIDFFIQNPNFLIEMLVIITLTILLNRFYPKFRGFMGEFWLKTELQKLSKKNYYILNDIMIENNNTTHQIDHIVLSKYGIFVIEMKNYFGYITGTQFDKKWCQHIGKHKRYFQNPLHQNYGHIKSLANALKIEESIFIPIVCFSNQAKLSKQNQSFLTQIDTINNYILRYEKKIVNIDIEKLYTLIQELNIRDKNKRKLHIKTIQKNLNNIKNNNICPQCGAILIKRKGQYGNFIGCSNFPKCKYTKK